MAPRRRIRVAILAGEASGDILGARVIAALRTRYPDLEAIGIGGPLMQAEGFVTRFPLERLSVMGLVEPLKRLPELLRIRRALYRELRQRPPDFFLGIDSPDFNLHLEYKLKRVGIPTVHLVSPSVWAWRQGRVAKIRRSVDLMLCLFPFETDIYRNNGVPVAHVGHPLADEIPLTTAAAPARAALGISKPGKVVALLPGSRGGEVSLLAPRFLACARELWRYDPSLSFVLPAANSARHRQLQQLLSGYPELPITLLEGCSREALSAADVVLVASGTATLEAMLLQRPMVVAYRMAPMSWWLISRLLRTPFAALPNILAGRALVPEFIQQAATVDALREAILALLVDPAAAARQTDEFAGLHRQLALGFGERVAGALTELLATTRELP